MDIKPMISPERLEQDAELLQEWLAKQPHLPKVDDKKRLICFLHHNKYSLEKTKQKLENYYTLRNKYPEIFKNRDPHGQAVARARVSYNVCLAKGLSKDGGRIIYAQPNSDTSIFNITDFITYGTMVCDLFFLEHELHRYSANITDCAGLQYGHLVRSLPWMKAAVDIFLNCYVTRFKAFHMINVSPGLEIVFTAFKNFLPAKFVDRFYVHTSAESLLKVVDKELVCSEYGGTGPSLAELDQHTIKLVEKYKDWFIEQGNISSNEQLRRKGENQVEEMKGSFRKLEVD